MVGPWKEVWTEKWNDEHGDSSRHVTNEMGGKLQCSGVEDCPLYVLGISLGLEWHYLER